MQPEAWNIQLPAAVEATMLRLEQALARQRVVERLWERDASLWHPSAETQVGITGRLGWLDTPEAQLAQARTMAAAIQAPALLIAPDDAGAAARLWIDRSGPPRLLDTWAPAEVRQVRLRRWGDVLVAADRSSPALDLLLAATDGIRSCAPVAALAPQALQQRLGAPSRKLVAASNARARFGALGSYGLVAAALAGRDLDAIVGGARAALDACRGAPGQNPGLRLGAALAALAQHNFDLLLLCAEPSEWRVAEWIAGLLAGALSKHRRGFVPIMLRQGQAVPLSPNAARIVLRPPGAAVLESRLPHIEFRLAGDGDAGALVATWQIAVAVAAVVIGVNPFDEPDTIAFEQRLQQRGTGGRPVNVTPVSLAEATRPNNMPADARWLALVSYCAASTRSVARLNRIRSTLQWNTARPVTLVEPLRHGWATQLLHAGRPDGFMIALVPPVDRDTQVSELVRARFELDLAAWRHMGRAFAVVEDS